MLNRRSLLGASFGLASAALAAPVTAAKRVELGSAELPLGAQLYTVGKEARADLTGTLKRLRALGYRTLEVGTFNDVPASEYRRAADAANMKITSVSMWDAAFGAVGSDIDEVVRNLTTVGARHAALTIPIMSREIARQDDEDAPTYLTRLFTTLGADNWKRTAALLNDRAEALQREGISLSYHNHNIEFAPVEGTTGWDILMQETNPALVGLEVDLGWLAAAGIDPVAFVKAQRGRVRQVHMKDITPDTVHNHAFRMTPAALGEGVIDWPRLLPALYDAGARQFFVEQEPSDQDPFEALGRSRRFLMSHRKLA